MERLSERLEVRVDGDTMRQPRLRAVAGRRGVSIGHVVREALDRELGDEVEERLRAARALFEVGASVADWSVLEEEIETARAAHPL